MKIKTLLLILCIFSLINLNCNKNDDVRIKVLNFSKSGCKDNKSINANYVEELHLKSINENQLSITHYNAVFNCCSGDIYAKCELSNDTLFIKENSTENSCNCICPYDINYIISPIQPNYYIINLEKFATFEIKYDSNLDTIITLTPLFI